jgi:uncharacterized damage-inducible protein DinB
MDAAGLPLAEIASRLKRVAQDRQNLMDRERSDGWRRVCTYKDSKGNSYHNQIDGLLLHVANHGIHHRAQALNFLKRFGRTVPGGLDYIFFRFAKPHLKQEPGTAEVLRKFGMEIESGSSPATELDAALIRNYFAYGDWANDRLLRLAAPLDDAALDRSWNMGLDTIRKTALHLADAERWWLRNWTTGPTQFERAAVSTSIAQLQSEWTRIRADRNRFIESLDATAAQRTITALFAPNSFRVPLIESLLQLCGHGTHHRAQLINMLRHSGATLQGTDYVIWMRENS